MFCRCKNEPKTRLKKYCTFFFVKFVLRISILSLGPLWCWLLPDWCNPGLVKKLNLKLKSTADEPSRIKEAENYLNFYSKYQNFKASHDTQVDILLGIVTRNRNYPDGKSAKYLTQTVGFLFNEMALTKFEFRLIVCNVDSNSAQKFVEANDLMTQYNISVYHNESVLRTSSIFDVEKHDYETCLRHFAQQKTPFVVVFEDDALAEPNVFGVGLRDIVEQIQIRKTDPKSSLSKLIFVKLYHPERLRKLPWLIQIGCYSILITCLFHFCLDYIKTRRICVSKLQIFIDILILYFVLYCLGHRTFAWSRFFLTNSIYLVPQESCCMPVVLYPRDSLVLIADYMRRQTGRDGYSKDHMLDEIPKNLNGYGLMTDLNLVKHIGRYSSVRSTTTMPDY